MVKLNRKCDLCPEGHKQRAIADVKLNYAYGGTWAYVCDTHYAQRAGNIFVTKLTPES